MPILRSVGERTITFRYEPGSAARSEGAILEHVVLSREGTEVTEDQCKVAMSHYGSSVALVKDIVPITPNQPRVEQVPSVTDLTIDELAVLIPDLNLEQLQTFLAEEQSGKGRVGAIEVLEEAITVSEG